jgi:hypothetical protein
MSWASDCDPCVDCVEGEPTQETLDQGSEYSYSIGVCIARGMSLGIEERIDTSGNVITRFGRRSSVRLERFPQCSFLARAELVMEKFRSNGSDRISEARRSIRLTIRRFVQEVKRKV